MWINSDGKFPLAVCVAMFCGCVKGGHTQLARDQLKVLAPQKPQHRLLLAPCRHSPPRLGRGPVSASVAGALRRAHAHPNRLVHPHLLAVAYLQSGVSANCRPGESAGTWALPNNMVNTDRAAAARAPHGSWWTSAPRINLPAVTPVASHALLNVRFVT